WRTTVRGHGVVPAGDGLNLDCASGNVTVIHGHARIVTELLGWCHIRVIVRNADEHRIGSDALVSGDLVDATLHGLPYFVVWTDWAHEGYADGLNSLDSYVHSSNSCMVSVEGLQSSARTIVDTGRSGQGSDRAFVRPKANWSNSISCLKRTGEGLVG